MTFDLDANGILHVTAEEKRQVATIYALCMNGVLCSSGQRNRITISNDKGTKTTAAAHRWSPLHAQADSVIRRYHRCDFADGSAVLSPAARRNIAVALAAQYLYCKAKMGITDLEWRRGGAFALAQLALDQAELDQLGPELMKELAQA